jgi:alanine-glyoxylate transaminase/serine-glyoxylate transaminase/serine-pyruvate transaminase
MIPGPVTVDDEVLTAMAEPVQPHYGSEWTTIYDETRELVKRVMQTSADVHILVGSGSSGLDAAVGSLTLPGETAILGTNGFFGDRLVQIAEAYGLKTIVLSADPTEPLDPAAFQRALDENPGAAIVGCVHHETATSVINPVEQISAAAKAHEVPIFVDTISSLGGMPYAMDDWGIDITVAASQKCLGAPPGLGPIAISDRAWQIMESKPARAHGWYLNLQTWRKYADEWGNWHPYPVTMATNNILALRTGLQQLLEEGIDNRIAYYQRLALRLRSGLRELGLQPVTPDESLSPVLTAVYAPEGVESGEIVRFLGEEHNLMISGGLGEGLHNRVFRVGHMSPRVGDVEIDEVLQALGAFMKVAQIA